MSGGRNRFFAYNSARRGSSGLKLGGLVGLFGPVRTRPAPTFWAVRFRCHGGLCPKLCGAVARPPVGLSTRARRPRIGARETCRTSPVSCRSSPPRRSYSRSKFQLWGALAPPPGGVSTRGRRRRTGDVVGHPRAEFGAAGTPR